MWMTTVGKDDVPVSYSSGGIYHKVFNVQVLDDEKYLRLDNGYTLADAYCVGCGMLLGWKFIRVAQPSIYCKEGRFLMKLDKLIYWNNDVPMNNENQLDDEQGEGANEQVPNDQDGGANEQAPNQDVDQLADGMDNIDLNPVI
uniref:Protein yippee-like At3g08990 n=1 Tax=Nicotiana tabacum TaxID=4097 RepID=A0A1S4AJ72_TOBAC|nr:protein yippee-like At3g08990 [Nicotiana tomentosiformis]XP_016476747.1 PREDICTED: protein yippee-like At3g08990 [Nicotiana tabacum]